MSETSGGSLHPSAATVGPPWPAVYLAGLPRALGWGGLTAVLAFVTALALPSRYESDVSFVPTAPDLGALPPSGLASLASRFGIAGSGGSESPEFYAALLTDRSILDPVILDTFITSAGSKVTLLDLLDAGGRDPSRKLELAAKKLVRWISTSADDQTNIVSLQVTLPDPLVAAGVANLLVARLDTFNQVSRKSDARARRRFLETRVAQSKQELTAAEDSLRDFYIRNRQISSSPTLLFEEARYKRAVDLQDNLYQSLSQQHEQARIDEVRDTPVLTVLQPAVVPTKRSWPKRGIAAAFALVAGVLLSFGVTTWQELTRRAPAAAQVDVAVREALRELAGRFGTLPWKWFRRA